MIAASNDKDFEDNDSETADNAMTKDNNSRDDVNDE